MGTLGEMNDQKFKRITYEEVIDARTSGDPYYKEEGLDLMGAGY